MGGASAAPISLPGQCLIEGPMQQNPFSYLLSSRRFWLLLLDTIISIAMYFIGAYGSPQMANDAKFLIGALQPVFLFLITALTIENVQTTQAQK